MPIADKISPAPREIRLAGALTALPGLAGVVLATVLLIDAIGVDAGGNILAESAYYVLLGAGTLACAIGLLMGKTWARSPAVVIALLLVGVGWYTTGPSGQPGYGIPVLAVGALVLVLLFRAPSRAWVLGQREGESEQEAATRDSAAGRAARRSEGNEADENEEG